MANKMNRIYFLFAINFFLFGFCQAQEVPAPASPQTKNIILLGAVAHLGNGEVIAYSAIGFADGKLTLVADANSIRIDRINNEIVDVTGKHVYPGLIAPGTTLGLNEIDAVRATRDFNEVGALNPNVRVLTAYSTDSRVTPTVRSNGVLITQVCPRGGRISGMSSVFALDGWNWEDAVLKADDGIHLNWPNISNQKGDWGEPPYFEANKEYDKQINDIFDYFNEAQAYAKKQAHESKNLKFEAMRGLFSGSKKLYVHVNGAKETMEAVTFARKYAVDMVVVGGRDAWRIADFLKKQNVAVILSPTHELPGREEEDIDLPYKKPYLLQQAGVLFCLGFTGGWGGSWEQRNLPFWAGTAAAYGLTKEEALAAVTSNTAKILGIDDRVGTLEEGKEATLIVSEGDVLDMRSSNITLAFVEGRQINLDNKQKMLYRKFRDKY